MEPIPAVSLDSLISMRNYFKRFSVLIGFSLLLILVIGNGILTRRKLAAQIESQSRLAETRSILLELEKTESLIKDAETGQRGYLYTGDAKYLAPYNQARDQVGTQLDELNRLAAGDTHRQAYVARLRSLSTEKLNELARTIALYQTGKPEDARAVVTSGVGLLTMDQIRRLLEQAEQEESVIEAMRTAEYEGSIRATTNSIYLASGLAAVGLVLLAYFIFREIALREKHTRDLREREEWFRVTLTSIGDAVIVTDPQGRIRFINPIGEGLTGTTMEQMLGRDILQVFPIYNEFTGEKSQNPVSRVMEQGRIVGLANHTVLQHTDGTLIPIEDSAAPIRDDKGALIGVVLVFRDVTSERKSQDLLRKSEKLTAAARLSATVAHEINNPLAAVCNLVYLAKQFAPGSEELVNTLELAERELERVAHLTRQTLGFYRESRQAEFIEIPALIDSVLGLFSNKIASKNVRIERDFEPSPPILGVVGELKQVISNLVSNALDAIGAQGVIRFCLQNIEDEEGGSVRIVIEDNGPGIPPDVVTRIFEPFFTTKKDIGTGLGLWVTKEIVERHGGDIAALARGTNGLHGASFSVTLPRNPNREARRTAVPAV